MHSECSCCALKFEREQGYFVGAIYVNYAVTIAVVLPGFFISEYLTAITLAQQLMVWIPFAIVFPLLFFCHSRSLWLAIDHLFNPPE